MSRMSYNGRRICLNSGLIGCFWLMGWGCSGEGADTDTRTRIPAFSLVSQSGEKITNANLRNKLYAAGFFFTRCPGICKDLTESFARIQDSLQMERNFRLVLHTVDPAHDSVPVLRAYAQKYGANPSQWYFLTGGKEEIYKLAQEGYFLSADFNDGTPENITHSGKIVLVDGEGFVLRYYNGLSHGEVGELINDVRESLHPNHRARHY